MRRLGNWEEVVDQHFPNNIKTVSMFRRYNPKTNRLDYIPATMSEYEAHRQNILNTELP